ncbi:S-adenosyl-L-methionine-dependent methyltransferase [Thelephora ganbajun]|uniref:S-adenosyl-L-methionine-dependent methyltransferase n=1 Tax=Thelephora ganbajun TaxID=370292 RepID=A0ACB6Z659_THEGA|nr:S-adenosyl-L-methionine-dependent methyltransferase [Thelephora ganbajun]
MAITALEFYCGIGGLHYALENSFIDARVLAAFDWDQLACRVYSHNFPETTVKQIDICTLTAGSLAAYAADLWLLSPSCQPYTVLNPVPRDSGDPRAKPFLHLINDVLPSMAVSNLLPSRLLIENVAGFETSLTRQNLLAVLSSLGYNVLEFLLTPLSFGIPNSRLRYYVLARFEPFSSPGEISNAGILRHIPDRGTDWVDDRGQSEVTSDARAIRDYLDQEGSSLDDCTIPPRVLEKWGRLFDIVLPASYRTCCFTRGYTKMVERTGSILQENESLDAEGDSNPMAILEPLRLRYFSPRELSKLFGFGTNTKPFIWPAGCTVKSKYRLIGNSVNVHVVAKLINYLFE